MKLRSSVFCLILMFLTTLMAAPPSHGLCGDVCEISIRPDVISVPLALEGWVVATGSVATVVVLEAPIFGTWAQEVYTPADDFWLAGGDRFRLEVRDPINATMTRHTILLNVVSGASEDDVVEDFEGLVDVADLGSEWHLEAVTSMDIVQVQNPSNKFLEINFNADQAQTGIQRTTLEPKNGIDQMTGSTVIRASPPDDPKDGTPNFTLTVLELGEYAYAELRHLNGVYSVRAVIDALVCTTCDSPWRTLQANHDYRIRMSLGRQNVQHPSGANTYSLEIRYRDLAGGWQVEDEIPDLTAPSTSQSLGREPAIGAFDVTGQGRMNLAFDDFKAGYGSLGPSLLSHQVEDFPGGTWSNDWLAIGPVSTWQAPAGSGSTGQSLPEWWGSIQLSSVFTNGNSAQWLDVAPTQSSTLWAHLKLKLNRLTMPKWSSFFLLEGRTDAGLSFLNLRVRTDGYRNLQIMARARDGSGAFQLGPWIDLGTGEVDVDLAWDGVNGSLDLWLDGQLESSLVLLPGPYRVDRALVGISQPMQGPEALEVTSTILIDDVALLYE